MPSKVQVGRKGSQENMDAFLKVREVSEAPCVASSPSPALCLLSVESGADRQAISSSHHQPQKYLCTEWSREIRPRAGAVELWVRNTR